MEKLYEMSQAILLLCMQACDNGIQIRFTYSPNTTGIFIDHMTGETTYKMFMCFFDHDDCMQELEEIHEYINNLIEGDNDVRT